MNWDDEVTKWLVHPVTKAFYKEIESDLIIITSKLVDGDTDDVGTIHKLRGMIIAFRGILGIGFIDTITEIKEETEDGRNTWSRSRCVGRSWLRNCYERLGRIRYPNK